MENQVIEVVRTLVQDWGREEPITVSTQIVADLGFESIDIIQLLAALEERLQRRNLGFSDLIINGGRYVDDLSISQIAQFLSARLGIQRSGFDQEGSRTSEPELLETQPV